MRRLRRPLLAASRWIIRMCIPFEASIIRCSRRHRLKIVGVLHPLSAVVLFSIIGFLFSYDLYYVAPKILDTGGPWYWLSVLLASFIVFNILGNWWLSFNTSTLVESLPPERQYPARGEAHLWHYCIECDKLVPPRSWHCKLCKGCMLKRDHHCTLSGNCIGHNNQRYFLCFLFYLALGCGKALVYNFIFAWKTGSFVTSDPILLLGKISEYKENDQLNFLYTVATIFKLNVFLFVVGCVMFGLQVFLVYRNSTCYMISDRSHDNGWRQNFEGVLGRRLFWTFLSPTIKSPLPSDGTEWPVKQKV